MDLSDFDFDLPEDLVALRPVHPRPTARMLVAAGGRTEDAHFSDLPDFLRPGDMLVLNDTAVIPARLFGTRHRKTRDGSGIAKVEAMLIHRDAGDVWTALARPARKLAMGDILRFGDGLSGEVIARDGAAVTIRFDRADDALLAAIEAAGEVPLPPYIAQRRAVDERDRDDYQTVFASRPGSVAAPTASLHFDDALLAALAARGVETVRVTLHVGAGTFLPVTAERVEDHRMHAEWGHVTPQAATAMNAARAAGGRLIAAGTTALRLIESATAPDGIVQPFRDETEIFIKPGYRFRATDGLITNFHLPRSTLFMLVSALMGMDRMQGLYAHAIAGRYRFYSYGDGSLLLPDPAI